RRSAAASTPELNAAENIWQYLRQTYPPTVYSQTTPPFSTPAGTPGENFSPKPAASRQSTTRLGHHRSSRIAPV
ncbi:MAG: hypothetical protein Q7N95_13965, partial [Alphaproteobacteria bacterium]|nr:hypothetical protein [Alphaproteobacteria bacterium]